VDCLRSATTRRAHVVCDCRRQQHGARDARGDLAIIRKHDTYGVGDVVTYRHPRSAPSYHRIIDTAGSRFVFRGDNNDFIDPYRPVQSELVGELWVHIPEPGRG